MQCRIPGAHVNPSLAAAAMIAAGLLGVENELPLEPAFDGNAYTAAADRAHYANAARVEIAAFDSAVTDWEMARNFEPIQERRL